MKKTVLISTLLIVINLAAQATQTREVTYRGQIDTNIISSQLYLSKFYTVSLKSDSGSAFQYSLISGIQPSQFNSGIYKTTSFNLAPTISASSTLPHRMNFNLSAPCVVNGESVSFEGEIKSEQKSIGKVKFEFNMYQLPIKKNYNPKVKQTVECSAPHRIEVIETRDTD
jgi:hypothetical protein